MENNKICFNEFKILEWYDGIIRAVGESQNADYLIVLVAWDMPQSMKIFTLFELDKDTKNKIVENLKGNFNIEEKWRRFTEIFDNFVKSYSGRMYMLKGELEKDNDYDLALLESKINRQLVNYDFENVLDSINIKYWLETYNALT